MDKKVQYHKVIISLQIDLEVQCNSDENLIIPSFLWELNNLIIKYM